MTNYFVGEEYDFSAVMTEASLPGNYDLEIEFIKSSVKERNSSITFDITRGGSITSEPLIMDGVVYIACCDHNVYALDIETGREIWRFSSQGPNITGVVHENGRLYFSSFDGHLYALNMKGRLLWKFSTGDKIAGRPIIHNDMIYIGNKSGNIYAVDSEGRLAWKFMTNGPIGNTGNVHDNIVYFSSFDYNLYALTTDGRILWKFAAGGEIGAPVIENDTIYFGSFDHCLYALDINGKLKWKFRSGDAFDPGSGIRAEGDTIYFGSKDYNLYSIRNGKVVWRFPTGHMIYSEAVISGDDLYFGSTDSNLYCVDKRTGKEIWKFGAGGPVLYLDKSGDRIVFGCHDCNMYCVSDKGELLWKFHTSLNYPVDIESETEIEHTVIINTPLESEGKSRKKDSKKELGSYGDFKGSYIQDDMRDYIGKPMGEVVPGMKYKAGKGTYR